MLTRVDPRPGDVSKNRILPACKQGDGCQYSRSHTCMRTELSGADGDLTSPSLPLCASVCVWDAKSHVISQNALPPNWFHSARAPLEINKVNSTSSLQEKHPQNSAWTSDKQTWRVFLGTMHPLSVTRGAISLWMEPNVWSICFINGADARRSAKKTPIVPLYLPVFLMCSISPAVVSARP